MSLGIAPLFFFWKSFFARSEQADLLHTTARGGYSTKFYAGRLPPEVQPLTLL